MAPANIAVNLTLGICITVLTLVGVGTVTRQYTREAIRQREQRLRELREATSTAPEPPAPVPAAEDGKVVALAA